MLPLAAIEHLVIMKELVAVGDASFELTVMPKPEHRYRLFLKQDECHCCDCC